MKQLTSNEVFKFSNKPIRLTIIPNGNTAILQTSVNGTFTTLEEYTENKSLDILLREDVEWRVTLPAGSSAYYY